MIPVQAKPKDAQSQSRIKNKTKTRVTHCIHPRGTGVSGAPGKRIAPMGILSLNLTQRAEFLGLKHTALALTFLLLSTAGAEPDAASIKSTSSTTTKGSIEGAKRKFDAGQLQDALSECTKLVDSGKDVLSARRLRAAIYQRLNRHTKAVAE
ncbi:MAG: hypothetical protein K2X93_10630, partial [Candidatus Obscuribacterales bacterium]|nr:hypothetical protein [Candidatus Obscuribacterales bacterium]